MTDKQIVLKAATLVAESWVVNASGTCAALRCTGANTELIDQYVHFYGFLRGDQVFPVSQYLDPSDETKNTRVLMLLLFAETL